MSKVTYEKEIAALLVIDPFSDFIPEGGKVWDRLKGVAEAIAFSMRCIIDTVQATTRPGSTLRPFKRQPGCIRRSNTAHGAASSAGASSLNTEVPVVSPTRIWICSSRNTAFIRS